MNDRWGMEVRNIVVFVVVVIDAMMKQCDRDGRMMNDGKRGQDLEGSRGELDGF